MKLRNADEEYLKLLRDVKNNGEFVNDRTKTGTYSVFGRQIRFAASPENFPLLTTKRVHFKSVLIELLWFLKGETNIKFLKDHGVSIWDEWADSKGELGPTYGKLWRDFEGADQISQVCRDLEDFPESRRHVVSAWHPLLVKSQKLPPCHCMFQFYSRKGMLRDQMLSIHVYMRSCDIFLGLPFNMASYALLLNMIAQVTRHRAHEVIMSFGDLHLYHNHLVQAEMQLQRKPKKQPKLWIDQSVHKITGFEPQHIKIEEYDSHPTIKAEVSV